MSVNIRHDLKVELMSSSGSDRTIAEDALVSSGIDYDESRLVGLINSLIRQKHGSPFESGYMRFRIEAPRAVRDEHVRHRIGSYSSTSLRYRMEPETMEFYIPPKHRPLKKSAGFKRMAPVYEPLLPEDWEFMYACHRDSYRYIVMGDYDLRDRDMTETEVRRWAMPDALYTPYIYRANPRMVMAFLSLRTHDITANHVSYPMWEIAEVAKQIEDLFSLQFPITHAAFCLHGREAP